MDGENYIAQLTAEERVELVRELGEYVVDIAERTDGDKERVPVLPLMVRERACRIIEAREPKIDVQYAMRSRKHGVEIADGARLSRVYFPTEESRDEGFRRAKRAAMEYSLWAQLYPDGNPFQQGAVAYVITTHNGVRCGTQVVDDGVILIYKTRADAQRVADILKREGV